MKKIIGSAVTASLLVGSAHAEIFELGKIEVASNAYFDDKKFNSNIVFGEDIVNNEKKTIVEALNTISGVNIYNSGARNEQMINVRGFDVKHVPLYIDGIPIAVAYDGYVDFSRFTTFDLSQIELSKGLTSPLLGANTFAGAVNLVTKKPAKEFEGTISAGTFTGGGKKGYISVGTNQEKYYVQISGSYLSRDNYPLSSDFEKTTLQTSDKREQSDTKDKKLNIKVGFTPNATDEYAMNYIKQTADKGVPPTTDPTGSPRYWDWNYWDKESIYLLSKTNFSDFYLKTRLFYDKFKNSLSIYTDNTYSAYSYGGVGNPSWYDDNTKGLSVELGEVNSGANNIKVALHAKQDTHTEGGANQAEVYEMSVNTYSLGVEDIYKASDKTKVIFGASYDKDSVQRADNTNYGKSGSYGSTSGGTDITGYGTDKEFAYGEASALNPMAKVEHTIDDNLKVYGGVAKKTRFPSIKDRYSFKFKTYIPNSDLKEETTSNYEIGFQKYFDNSTFKGNIFYADIKDFIQSAYVDVYYGTKQQLQLQNVGKVTQKGLELEYFHSFENKLTFDGSYTRLSLKDKDNLVEITNVPTDKLAMALSYKPLKNLTTNLDMQYASTKKTSQTAPYNETGAMTVWNTKIIYDVTKSASVDVGVTNLFDKNYQLDYGFPEAGRVVFTNLTYKF
ncbi:MAG: TonB-dependent receptor [Arcobacteraceae bacterium]|nr:TonB-dependent receptor [Arcobacteraceae bacterium]